VSLKEKTSRLIILYIGLQAIFFCQQTQKSLHMSNIHSISTTLTNQFPKVLFEKNGSFSSNGRYAKMLSMCRQWVCRADYTSSMLEETSLFWDSLHYNTKKLCNFVPNNNIENFKTYSCKADLLATFLLVQLILAFLLALVVSLFLLL